MTQRELDNLRVGDRIIITPDRQTVFTVSEILFDRVIFNNRVKMAKFVLLFDYYQLYTEQCDINNGKHESGAKYHSENR